MKLHKIIEKTSKKSPNSGGFFSKGRPTWQLVLCEPMIFTDVKVMGKGVVSSPNTSTSRHVKSEISEIAWLRLVDFPVFLGKK